MRTVKGQGLLIWATLLGGCSAGSFGGMSNAVKGKGAAEGGDGTLRIQRTVEAGALVKVPSTDLTSRFQSDMAFVDKEKAPIGARVSAEGFAWQSDLQDFGGQFVHEFLLKGTKGELKVKSEFVIVDPKVTPRECAYVPESVIGDVAPQEMWHWQPPVQFPLTYSSPVAGDVDGDGKVEVVAIASRSGNWPGSNPPRAAYGNGGAVLAVINGQTGETKWDISSGLNVWGLASSTPALADLDGDGSVEIVVVASPVSGESPIGATRNLVILDAKERRIKATNTQVHCVGPFSCSPAVGDIDGDGRSEIVAGDAIFNADGTLRKRLPVLASYTDVPTNGQYLDIPTLADLVPNSPGLEIIRGSQVSSAAGNLLWSGECKDYTAVADVSGDGSPDLVCVAWGYMYLYSSSGTVLWKKAIPKEAGAVQHGGAPNIGDFNGDGKLEIGTAGGDYYVVFSNSGEVLWKLRTEDWSSTSTGSTIFDFNGDGKVEVVYNDEKFLRILDGTTGAVLWQTANESGTLWEYPLVLNIDDDPAVEIVVSSPDMAGVRAFKDPTHRWVGSRTLWNQYSYYPEIVDDKLKSVANPGFPQTGFRVNSQGMFNRRDRKILLPDLTAVAPHFFDMKGTSEGEALLTFFLKNEGEAKMGSGVTLVLKEGGESIASERLGEILEPGQGMYFKMRVPNKENPEWKLELNKDSNGAFLQRECEVENNTMDVKPLVRGR